GHRARGRRRADRRRGGGRRAGRPVRHPGPAGRVRGHRGGTGRWDGVHPLVRRGLPRLRGPRAGLPPAVPDQRGERAGRLLHRRAAAAFLTIPGEVMDHKNPFESPVTYKLHRAEYFVGLLIVTALIIIHFRDIRWIPAIGLFAYIDLIGYIPGAIAFRRSPD